MADEPSRVQLADVTEAAFSGVLRALEARKLTPDKFPGPILVGIIAWLGLFLRDRKLRALVPTVDE